MHKWAVRFVSCTQIGQFAAIRDGNEPMLCAMTSCRVSTNTLTVVPLVVIMHLF